MSRLRSNCSVIWLMPNDEVDVIGGERRDLPELALERRRDQIGDGVGAGAGQLRRHLDGREIDLRQGRYRQPPIAERTADRQREPNSEVAIGRRMNGFETLICGKLPELAASASRLPPPKAAGRPVCPLRLAVLVLRVAPRPGLTAASGCPCVGAAAALARRAEARSAPRAVPTTTPAPSDEVGEARGDDPLGGDEPLR